MQIQRIAAFFLSLFISSFLANSVNVTATHNCLFLNIYHFYLLSGEKFVISKNMAKYLSSL